MSSMMISSSVVPGSIIDAKYSVMFGEQHLASTDTSYDTVAAVRSYKARHPQVGICPQAQQACLVYVFNVILSAHKTNT